MNCYHLECVGVRNEVTWYCLICCEMSNNIVILLTKLFDFQNQLQALHQSEIDNMQLPFERDQATL